MIAKIIMNVMAVSSGSGNGKTLRENSARNCWWRTG